MSGLTDGASYASEAERLVAGILASTLSDSDRVWPNQRVTDDHKNAEVDFFLAIPGAGFAVIEVKGGQITRQDDHWIQTGQHGRSKRVDPVRQAREGMYGLRRYVESDPRWGSRGRVRWAHAVVFPFTSIAEDFALPDCPRHMVFGRDDLDRLVEDVASIATRQESGCRVPSIEDVEILEDIMRGRGLPQSDVITLAAERDAMSDRLTEQQGMLLEASRLMARLEIRGGAGSGKTWLALEQARRLRREGERVALVCYSRGLAAYFERVTSTWERRERPSYVGTFHNLGIDEWGAKPSPAGDDDSDYWEHRLPAMMVSIAGDLDVAKRFDAIVVDEAQDFADQWWPAVEAALKDPGTGSLTIFSDEGQRVFARFGGVPECQAVFVLEHNLRNTRQIAETFQPLGLTRMRLRGGEGARVRFMPCTAGDAIRVADEAVEAALDSGWRPQDVALLTTGSRHPEQADRQRESQDSYWASFWDDDQVFYGHVLGFKGLERRVIILAVNESEARDRARERLYVGLSRARDELVVCGDLDYIAAVGGEELARRLVWSREQLPGTEPAPRDGGS